VIPQKNSPGYSWGMNWMSRNGRRPHSKGIGRQYSEYKKEELE